MNIGVCREMKKYKVDAQWKAEKRESGGRWVRIGYIPSAAFKGGRLNLFFPSLSEKKRVKWAEYILLIEWRADV